MTIASPDSERWTTPHKLVAFFALVTLAVHCATNGAYGYFRDELYFLACGAHLDWGYADHAPMIGWIARLSRGLFGDSLHAIRFLPALASAITVVLVGLMTMELGGRRYAVLLACLATLVAPIFLTVGNVLMIVSFEPVWWTACAYFLVLAVSRNEPRYLLGFGVAAGLGLETKHTMLFFGFAIAFGILTTPTRALLRSKWFWIGGAIAALIFVPNLLWEQQHHWATLELLSNVQKTHKNVSLSPLQFIAQQFLLVLPFAAPVWISGLIWLFSSTAKPYRFLATAFLVFLALMILLKGKVYYPAPYYGILFAAGGVALEKWLGQPSRSWLRVGYPAILLLTGIAFAPLSIPVLPVETFLRYERAIGFKPPKTEVAHDGLLPQLYGDQFGWPELVAAVATAYNNLPADERAKTAIYCSNYGEAGAIDLLGPQYGLPPAICPHQSYFLWGPRDYTGEQMIVLQSTRAKLEKHFTQVEAVAELDERYAMAEEHQTIYLCRGGKTPLATLWPELKVWN